MPDPDVQAESAAPNDSPFALLIEDNPTDVFVIRKVLAERGVAVQFLVAGNGERALSYLAKIEDTEASACPAFVILDLNLPRISGFDVLRRIRSGSRCSQIPVIVVSSSGEDLDRLNALKLGANAYFRKPADLTEYTELAQIVKTITGFAP